MTHHLRAGYVAYRPRSSLATRQSYRADSPSGRVEHQGGNLIIYCETPEIVTRRPLVGAARLNIGNESREIQTGRKPGNQVAQPDHRLLTRSRSMVRGVRARDCGPRGRVSGALAGFPDQNRLARFSEYAIEGFGFRLIAKTPELMGPDASRIPACAWTGNRLSCGSCICTRETIQARWPFRRALHYPKFSARTAAIRTLEDRVNECMVRSGMNGKPLAKNSPHASP